MLCPNLEISASNSVFNSYLQLPFIILGNFINIILGTIFIIERFCHDVIMNER